MQKSILPFLIFLLIASTSFGQGTNNDFDFDNQDLKFLFSKLGYGVFKFPVKQSRDQIFDIIVEEYRDGQLSSRKTAIEITAEAFKDFGIDAKKYAKPKMDSTMTDSVYFHRFYTERSDSILTVHVNTHGITTPIKFDIKDLSVGNVRARYETKEEIDSLGFMEVSDKKKVLILFYANKDPNKPLWCPAGLPLEEIKKRFYYATFVFIEALK